MKPKIYLLALFFGLFAAPVFAQGGGCVCTNCPQYMPDFFVGNFNINVQGADNNILGQNGQGVCGVTVHFEHTAICDISITLISPAGQSVTLVGPIGNSCNNMGTVGTDWDISFVPCADPAAPDPGFANQWSNAQPWAANTDYTGVYYPFAGCLENFNAGPVNGNWQLNVTDGQAQDDGNLFNYEIIFCDGSGISCVSCAANAGNLLQPDLMACEGEAILDLTLPPTYVAPNVPPPAASYSYTYVISQNGIIIDYDPTANLTGLPAGNYSVCGMSFLTTDGNEIPAPNGTLTVAQLTMQLNSSTPPFCGKITSNCVNVLIKLKPADVEETEVVCFGECVTMFGELFCATGTFVRNLTSPLGCPYLGTLHLTVLPLETEAVSEVICGGDCSQTPGFATACTSGIHTETFTNPVSGCDSVVTLNLNVLTVVAVIQPPAPITCSSPSVVLSSAGSTVGGVNYEWSGPGIVGPANGPTCTVNLPGSYQLIVKKTVAGVTCSDTTAATVTTTVELPAAPANLTGQQLVCPGQSFIYTAAAVSTATSYDWTLPAGATITAGQNTNQITVLWGNTGGNLCVMAVNSCGTSAPTCLQITLGMPPAAPVISGNDTICGNATEVYSMPNVPGATAWNWTVPPGATITAGQNSGSITVNWGNSTGGQVCVTVSNACGPSGAGCLNVVAGLPPVLPVISGNATACVSSIQNYTVAGQAGLSFTWTVSNGGTITAGQGSNQVSVQWAGNSATGTACVSTTNFCGNSPQACFSVALETAPAAPDLAAIQAGCAPQNATISIQNVANATSYFWTVPAGVNIVSGQGTTAISVDYSAPPGGLICVAAVNNCGTGPTDCEPIIIWAQSAPNAGPDDQTCGLTYQLTGQQGTPGTTLGWSQLSGPGMAAFQNPTAASTQVTVNQYGSYFFLLEEINGACQRSNSVEIIFNENPAAGQIATTCNPANTGYSISFPISGGQSPWTVAGGSVAGGIFTSNEVPSGQPFSFTILDANGCSSAAISGIFNCNCLTKAGTMSQTPLEVCDGQTVTAVAPTNAVLDGNDVASFVLHDNGGTSLGNIFGQNLSGTFGIQAGMNFGQTYFISYFVGDDLAGFPDPADGCRSVSQGTPVVFYENPTANAGPNLDTCGSVIQLNALPSVGFGNWLVASSPPGGMLSFAAGQNPATFATASESGDYGLFWQENNHGCASQDALVLTFGEIPTAINVLPTCDPTGQFYTVNFTINAGIAPFSVNGQPVSGNAFSSGQIASGAAWNFVVTDANGCASAPITGLKKCNCLGDAGTMSASLLTICEGQTAQATAPTGVILDGNDVGAFILQNLGSASLGQILDINQTGEFAFLPGVMSFGTTYFISYLVGNDTLGLPNLNDPCLDVNAGQPVVFYQNPTANAGFDQALCGFQVDFAANQFGQGNWTTVSKPPAATVIFGNATAATTSATVSAPGVFEFEWTISQNGCTDSDLVEMTFTAAPTASAIQKTCNAGATQYALSFQILGGVAPFQVSGVSGQLAGNQFISDALANNSSFSVTLTDAAGCTSELTGSHDCACSQTAGAMAQTPLSICGDDLATAVFLGGNQQNAGDSLFFILHDGPLNAVGNVFQTSTTPQFSWQPPLIFGQTYFISAVVTAVLPNGEPDFNFACLDLAKGQPVVFHPKPSASLAGDAAICSGEAATLVFECLGDGPFVVNYSANGQNFSQNVGLGGSFSKIVTPSLSTIYSLISVSDGNSPACSTTLTDSVEIAVGQPAAATIQLQKAICNNGLFGSIVDFKTLILSGDATGFWVDLDGSGAVGNLPVLNFEGITPGNYSFEYTTAAAEFPCPQLVFLVEITVNDCPCPSVATTSPAPLCNDGGGLNLSSITTTTAPGVWSVTNGPSANPVTISNNFLDATGATAGVYELTFKLQPAPPVGCPAFSTQLLTVAEAAFAGTAGQPAAYCVGEDWGIDLFQLFDDAPDLGGFWTETSVIPTVSGAFLAAQGQLLTKNLAAGLYKFTYKINGTPPCPAAAETVSVVIFANPTADAGPNALLDCFGTAAILGGPGTSVGGGVSHFWEKDGQPITATTGPTFSATEPGIYTLTVVENPLGCEAFDEATVTQAVAANGLYWTAVPSLCFGESVGTISIDSIAGGQPPLLFSIDGGPFSPLQFWGNLAAGTHEIRLQDVNGCELSATVELAAPLPLTVNLGPDTLLNLGDSLTVFAQIGQGLAAIDTLIWLPLLNAGQAGLAEQSFTPLARQLLTLTVIDENGCRETDQILVRVDKTRHVYVPNIFSPSSNENGLFTIYGGQDVVKIRSFQVFDRWGEPVFEQLDFLPNDPTTGWNGAWKGEKMGPAVFVWWAEVLFLDGVSKIYKGDVILSD